MGYKHSAPISTAIRGPLAAPNFLLKIIPHVDGAPRICELVEYYLEDIQIKGAWTGPAALSLTPHALAPVAELPVLEVVSAVHILADLTLGLGKVVHDYLARSTQPSHTRQQEEASCVSRTRLPSSPAPPAASARRLPRPSCAKARKVVIADLNQKAADAAATELGGAGQARSASPWT